MTDTLCLLGNVTGNLAARHFQRPRLRNLYGLLTQPVRVAVEGEPESRVPPFVERIWLPAYAVRMHAIGGGKDTSIWMSVEAWSGQCTMLDCADELQSRTLKEQSFPPHIDEAEAATLARRGVLQFILYQRGQRKKPIVDRVEEIRLYYFPIWVLYFRRYNRALDIKVLDGRTGKPAGAKIRMTILNAFVATRKAEKNG